MKRNLYALLILISMLISKVNGVQIMNNTNKVISICEIFPKGYGIDYVTCRGPITIEVNPGEMKEWIGGFYAHIDQKYSDKYCFKKLDNHTLITFLETDSGDIKAYQSKDGAQKEVLPKKLKTLKIVNNCSRPITIQEMVTVADLGTGEKRRKSKSTDIESGKTEKLDFYKQTKSFEVSIVRRKDDKFFTRRYNFSISMNNVVVNFSEVNDELVFLIDSSSSSNQNNDVTNITITQDSGPQENIDWRPSWWGDGSALKTQVDN